MHTRGARRARTRVGGDLVVDAQRVGQQVLLEVRLLLLHKFAGLRGGGGGVGVGVHPSGWVGGEG